MHVDRQFYLTFPFYQKCSNIYKGFIKIEDIILNTGSIHIYLTNVKYLFISMYLYLYINVKYLFIFIYQC